MCFNAPGTKAAEKAAKKAEEQAALTEVSAKKFHKAKKKQDKREHEFLTGGGNPYSEEYTEVREGKDPTKKRIKKSQSDSKTNTYLR